MPSLAAGGIVAKEQLLCAEGFVNCVSQTGRARGEGRNDLEPTERDLLCESHESTLYKLLSIVRAGVHGTG